VGTRCSRNSYRGRSCVLAQVTDAAYYAQILGRVLVEPAVKDSRIVNPFDGDWGGLTLADYWDIGPLCRYTRVAPLWLYLEMEGAATAMPVSHEPTSAKPRVTMPKALRDDWSHTSAHLNKSRGLRSDADAHEVEEHFAPFRSKRVIVLSGVWKTGGGIGKLSHNMPQLSPAPSLVERAATLACRFRGSFTCVQWRTEDSVASLNKNSTTALSECAASLAVAANDGMRRAGLSHRPTVLISDLLQGNSGTLHRDVRQANAENLLTNALPVDTDAMAEFRKIQDSGLRSMVEMEVCARSTLVITCHSFDELEALNVTVPNTSLCQPCAKLNSGFTRHMLMLRNKLTAGTPHPAGSQCALPLAGTALAWRRRSQESTTPPSPAEEAAAL